jgi:hypothetical protein
MKNDTRILIKDLFESYELSFKEPLDGFEGMACKQCNSVAKYDNKTDTYEKLKHKPECCVAIMRNRIRIAINEDKN